MTASARANPLALPTAQFTADVEITRPTDFAVRHPARYVYGAGRLRVDYGPLVTLVDLERKQTTIMMPRVRTYWRASKIAEPVGDARRWIGVEAKSAEPVATEVILGREVTRYRVRGTIFDSKMPFEGDVWTTPENIVLRVDGVGRENGQSWPVKLTTVQLVVAPPDPAALVVPPAFGRAPAGDVSWRDGD
jgi:hypothetical protein